MPIRHTVYFLYRDPYYAVAERWREFPVRTTIDPAAPLCRSLQSAGTPLEACQWRPNGLPRSLGSCTPHECRGVCPAGRLYMTGDLRALTGLPRTHMDFYLREGIIQPTTRTGSGYLLFDHAELETLRAVLRWREEGVGIREIRDRLGRPASH